MNPYELKATLLSDATAEEQQEFARMLAKECADFDLQNKGHRCWFFVPTLTEWERMKKYAEPPHYDQCRKCQKGRLRVEVFHGNIGSSWTLKCSQCDFSEYISDDE